jgi:hypothetical protein
MVGKLSDPKFTKFPPKKDVFGGFRPMISFDLTLFCRRSARPAEKHL